ncbi:hypothetical protein DOTSEDRAFT_155047 [Dothistroma septosporum NZE10]|uniref:Uncharacterized protein n=1 Tax=Dothistroma septosporum (strain NZE10 / CBS 128990) TaxID=675120 RepID=N1PLB2_DOTSN|nr:hypothetical protein DOTSEDRAFT_155047 [Dothistroma septosporum NZE10]
MTTRTGNERARASSLSHLLSTPSDRSFASRTRDPTHCDPRRAYNLDFHKGGHRIADGTMRNPSYIRHCMRSFRATTPRRDSCRQVPCSTPEILYRPQPYCTPRLNNHRLPKT